MGISVNNSTTMSHSHHRTVACNCYFFFLISFWEQTGYSVVSACVITLRWNDRGTSRRSLGNMSIWQEGVLCLVIVALCGFIVGLCYRFNYAIAFMVVAFVIAVAASFALQFRQVNSIYINLAYLLHTHIILYACNPLFHVA
jgi:hypothetical protein